MILSVINCPHREQTLAPTQDDGQIAYFSPEGGAIRENIHFLLLGNELNFALHIVRTGSLNSAPRWSHGCSATLLAGRTHDDRNAMESNEEGKLGMLMMD